jgi:hypothetical protein
VLRFDANLINSSDARAKRLGARAWRTIVMLAAEIENQGEKKMRPSTPSEVMLRNLALAVVHRETDPSARTRVFTTASIELIVFSRDDFSHGLSITARQPRSGKFASVFCCFWGGKLIEPQTVVYLRDGSGWEAHLRLLASGRRFEGVA